MKHKTLLRIFLLFSPVVMLFMNSCSILNPNIMLTTKRDYVFDSLNLDSSSFATEYRLAPNDVIELKLFANDGYKMIDLIAGNNQNTIIRQGFEYTLDANGFAKLPILGMVKLDSMTLREAETHLEERYAVYYVEPFVIVKVVNRRVIIFPGEPGNAKVIPLQNNNTTIFEAIALAGGISGNGKANKIKLIRQTNNPNKPEIYRLDLSKIENIAQGNIVVQTNDIIYVEPRRRYAFQTLQEITPIMSLFTTAFTFYVLINRL